MRKKDFSALSRNEKIAYLQNLLEERKSESESMYPQITYNKKERYSYFPLSETQESFFVGKLMESEEKKVGCHIYCEIEERNLDVDRLNMAWNKLVLHHDMLRDRITEKGLQRIEQGGIDYKFEVYDKSEAAEEKLAEHIEMLRGRLSHKVYRAMDYPLYEICVTRKKEEVFIIHFSIDEWIVDASSVAILLEQWYGLYHSKEYKLEPLSFTFRDFVLAQKKFEESKKYQEDLKYWKNKLSNINGEEMDIVKPVKSDTGKIRKRYEYVLNHRRWSGLKKYAEQFNISPTAILLTLFLKVCSEYNAGKSYPLVLTHFNRLPIAKDIDKAVGPFITTMIYQEDAQAEKYGFDRENQSEEFVRKARQVQKQLWDDNDHNSISGIRILRELKKEKRVVKGYVIPIVFTSMINNVRKSHDENIGTWFDQITYNITQTPQVYLDHQIMEADGTLIFNWDVLSGYFKDGVIEKMFSRYCDLLESNCDGAVALVQIEKNTEEERKQEFDLTDLQASYLYSHMVNEASDKERLLYQEFLVEEDSIERIKEKWQQLVDEIDMLRVVFTKDGKQKVLEDVPVKEIPVIDLSGEEESLQEAKLDRIREKIINQGFSMYQWPMFDVRIIRLGERKLRVNIAFDTAIMDGQSLEILYKRLFDKEDKGLKEQVTFHEYIKAKKSYEVSQECEEKRIYWDTKFRQNLNAPFAEYFHETGHGSNTRRISGKIADYHKLSDLAKEHHVCVESILMTVYLEVIATKCKEKEFSVVRVGWERILTQPSIQNTIGEFTALGWVTRRNEQKTFWERVLDIEKQIKKDLANKEVSGLSGLRKAKYSKSFPVVFTGLAAGESFILPENVTRSNGLSKTPQVYLDNISFVEKNHLLVNWDYLKDIFPTELINEMFEEYVKELNSLCRDNKELEQRKVSRNCIHEFVEEQAKEYPKNIALRYMDESLTYEELDRKANQLANYLRKQGVGRDELVAICLEKSIDMIVAILAILKAGGAYVPIDPSYPGDRINYILKDSQTRIVITKEESAHKIESTALNKLYLDTLHPMLESCSTAKPSEEATKDSLAYIIYTSGSTGKPKGVLITHHNVVRLFEQTQHWFGFHKNDVFTMYHSYAFDFSVWEIWGALLYGGTLVVVPYEVSRSFSKVYELLEKEKVTVFSQTPTAFKQLMKVEEEEGVRNLSLRYIIFGGEALNLQSLSGWFQRHGDSKPQLINMYGITETTVHVTYRPIKETDIHSSASLIGIPIPDLSLYILDENLNKVAAGETGEICVGGPGVAKGDLNRPDITKEKFIDNPFYPGERLYLSGDLGRYQSDYDIEYMGRKDNQVKVRGFRIELGEIENVLLSHPQIKEAAVVIEKGEEDNKIRAFLVIEGQELSGKDIRHYVRSKLPDYMVPNIIDRIDHIPITINGKLDYQKLMNNDRELVIESHPANKEFTREERLSSLYRILQDELKETILNETDDIFDLGATSLTIVNIAKRVQEECDIQIPIDVFLDKPAISEIGDFVIGLLEEKEYENIAAAMPVSKVLITGEELIAIFKEELGEQQITPEEDIFDLGATSLTIVNVVKKIKEKKGIEVSIDIFLDHPTINEIVSCITNEIPPEEMEEKHTDDMAAGIELSDVYLKKEDYKKQEEKYHFESKEIAVKDFSGLLSLLKNEMVGIKNRYLYASAGGKNAVQTYLYIKDKAVEGIPAGIYYYHPEEHQLYFLTHGNRIIRDVYSSYYREAFDQSAFAIFFIAQLKAIEPVYLDFSKGLVTIDTGYMQELLLSNQETYRVGLCSVEEIDFSQIRDDFLLEEGHIFVNGMLCGYRTDSSEDKVSLQKYLSERNESLTSHCKSVEHIIDESSMRQINRQMKYNQLSKREVLDLAKQKLHLRKFDDENIRIALMEVSFDKNRYLMRSSKREYKKEEIALTKFSTFLSVLRGKEIMGTVKYLYPSLLDAYLLKVYVYVKENAVEQLDEGLYRYDPLTHRLLLINKGLETIIGHCHTPFNRPHYKASGFSIFLLADIVEARRIYGDGALKYIMTESGYMGQLLMEHQAKNNIGIVPIGGMNFDKIRESFHLENKDMLIHSFMGGLYDYSAMKVQEAAAPQMLKAAKNDIAIIGLSGRFPDAADLSEYWDNLKNQKRSITKLPLRRKELWNGADLREEEYYGGYIEDIELFDYELFHMSLLEAKNLDPQERIMLQMVYECIEGAGYTIEALHKKANKVGVFIGSMWNDYEHYGVEKYRNTKVADIASLHSSIANRISYYFNFCGPSLAIQTACSSSMTALHIACESIKSGECDMAVVGGINLISHPYHLEALKSQNIIAMNGEVKLFSDYSTGLVCGEGAGAVLLTRLTKAIEEEDLIWATIKNTAIANYGKTTRYGMVSLAKQKELIAELLKRADINPDSIQYVEASAAGLAIADVTEVQALSELFAENGLSGKNCLIGSVKANIGHLESASFLSQLCKVILQMQQEEIVPTILDTAVNPLIHLDKIPFQFAGQLQKWPVIQKDSASLYRALINSFGASGSIGSAIVEQFKPVECERAENKSETAILLSAACEEQLNEYIKRIANYIKKYPHLDIRDVAYTLSQRTHADLVRVVFLCRDTKDLTQLAANYLQGETSDRRMIRKDTWISRAEERDLTNLQKDAFHWTNQSEEAGIFVSVIKANKIYLPVRPFNKMVCWNSKIAEFTNEKADDSSSSEPVGVTDKAESEADELVEYLVNVYAMISEIPVSKIDCRMPLENYGLSSIIISRFNKVLEQELSIKSSTLLFEVQTLLELSELLLADYRGNIMNSKMSELVKKDSVKAPMTENITGTKSATEEQRAEEQKTEEGYFREDIAIIGLGGIYPDADNLEELWSNLEEGRDSIIEIPLERWDHKAYFENDHKGNVYANWGGFLHNMEGFDPLFFQISPKEAMLMDPQERKFLEVVYHTLEDAGYTKKSIHEKYQGNVGVYVGAMFQDYQMLSGKSAEEESYIATGAVGASISNRISYILDLHGPSMTVNTMCSSVLTCLNLAVQSIHSGECRAAIVGGVNLIVHPNKYVLHCQNRMLSTDGKCRAFGKDGDGFVPSEGVGAILIKPLSEAINDKDHIYGTIKGIKINHDGKKNGYMVPSPVQQGNLIKSVLEENHIPPETITYAEAHGTGTKLGDPIEIAGLSYAYKDMTDKKNFCSIGSIKSNIGHCESAAGIASITKVLLQMKHKMLVPTIHCDELNPNIDFDNSPFYVQKKLAPWKVSQDQSLRRASVSSFGAGGVNGYLILEEYRSCAQSSLDDNSKKLLVMSAHNANELKEYVDRTLYYLTQIYKNKNTDMTAVKKIISEVLHIDSCSIDITEKLMDLGLSKDQLDLIIAQIESTYQIKMENEIIVQNETIETLIENIKVKTKSLHTASMNEYGEYTLRNIAHTLLHGREHMEERIAVIAATLEELVEILKDYSANPATNKVLTGNTENECNVSEEYEAFFGQEANQKITEDTIKEYARFYVNGAKIDWESVTDDNGAYKVSLPAYPFAKKKYWVPVKIEYSESAMNTDPKATGSVDKKTLAESAAEKEGLQADKEYVQTKIAINDGALEKSISAMIKKILGQILRLEEQDINLNYELQKYGVDSIMLSDLAEHINKAYDIHTTAAMLLSFHTIKDLVKGLQKKYSPEITLYEMKSRKTTDIIGEEVNETVKETANQVIKEKEITERTAELIAVIGIAGMAPGAENVIHYWEKLLANQCSITACKEDRRELREYLRMNSDHEDIMHGGYLNDIDKWEPLFFGISPNEAKRMDPQQRLFLEVSQRALEDAGYPKKRISGTKTGVFVGSSNDDYSKIAAGHSVMDAHSAIGTARSLIANRVSYYFNINGPSEVIDTACSSSGVAINRAIKALRYKECDMSIVGGVNLILTPEQFISYDNAGMLAKNRKVSVFSNSSDGYLRGEGVGCVILKPLSKAVKDNDRIHAVLLGSAVNHGGKAMSITTPNYEAQMAVVKEACRDSNVSEKTITYIEAQGSGNKIGDTIEWQALEEAYGETLDGRKRGVGTIKANIGHLESASGIFALIKIIFAMKHKIIPAMIHCDQISDDIHCNHNTLVRKNMEWDALMDMDGNLLPRRAGINAYGIGGVNAHFIVEEYVNEDTEMSGEKEESLFALSANSKEALKEYIKRVKEFACQQKDTNLMSFAYTLQIGREEMPYRTAFVAGNWETVVQKCNHALEEDKDIHNCSMDITHSILEQVLEQSGIDMIVKESIKVKKLWKIGLMWSSGVEINWQLLYEGKKLQITDTPEYPFEKESFWISDLSVKKNMDVETAEEKDQIIDILVKKIAEISGADSLKIAEDVPLIQYGFDSIMFTKLKYYIETQFMINAGSNEIYYRDTVGKIAAMIRKKMAGVIEDTTKLEHIHGDDLNDLFEKLTS
ncbi:non-ribosomal peptide synthetase [Anaerocolumna xylanovorans]|uniref:Amino acid adenylation domain-containing protein n=1 Tax=Anaerocolumna xylanovorans DSM 12503 TaxID=1121345 RepID=A0A1M7XZC5_9FIRM|nr:non-ribosomal peptide synthetase [Anaerocolumna xylanovorans]SHO44484.1 amino acid adenylation domain-containing protein [Anaerocolumna xylanovorans DSM 12503]